MSLLRQRNQNAERDCLLSRREMVSKLFYFVVNETEPSKILLLLPKILYWFCGQFPDVEFNIVSGQFPDRLIFVFRVLL